MAKRKKHSPPLKKSSTPIPKQTPQKKKSSAPVPLAFITVIIIIVAILAYKEVISGTVSIIVLVIATLAFQVFLGIKRSKDSK